jgi:hypothetical protein
MDGLQFLASVIGSIAWPGAVLVVLWYNRVRLSNLFSNAPDWVEELTLPGGTKTRFSKAVQKAAETAELIAAEIKKPEADGSLEAQPKGPNVIPASFRFYEPLVVESFLEIVELCGELLRFLPLPTKGRDPESVVSELVRLGFVDAEFEPLYKHLREGYLSAVRAGYGRVTRKDALRYRTAALTLTDALREALRRVEHANPRQQAGWG